MVQHHGRALGLRLAQLVQGVLLVQQAGDLIVGVACDQQVAHVIADAGADVADAGAASPVVERHCRGDGRDQVVDHLDEQANVVHLARLNDKRRLIRPQPADLSIAVRVQTNCFESDEEKADARQEQDTPGQRDLRAERDRLVSLVPGNKGVEIVHVEKP